jgi:hypothetical protein
MTVLMETRLTQKTRELAALMDEAEREYGPQYLTVAPPFVIQKLVLKEREAREASK